MKTSLVPSCGLLTLSILTFMPGFGMLAAETNSAVVPATPQPSATAASSAAATAAPEKLPYGVADVLKLSRAQISEDIIVNYVQNSGTIYNLSSQDIVYLHEQGVSDRVVSAMLTQSRRTSDAASATVAAQPAAAAPEPVAAPVYTEPAAVAPEAAPAYEQTAVAGSTVYVIPYPGATAAYYGYYRAYPSYPGPYYYGGYYGPVVSFGFGYGGYRGYHGGHGYYGGHYGHHR